MKTYNITRSAVNVLNEPLPDQIFCQDENYKRSFASYFERFKYPINFETIDLAFEALLDQLNENERYFFDEETGHIFKLISDTQIYKTGYKIK